MLLAEAPKARAAPQPRERANADEMAEAAQRALRDEDASSASEESESEVAHEIRELEAEMMGVDIPTLEEEDESKVMGDSAQELARLENLHMRFVAAAADSRQEGRASTGGLDGSPPEADAPGDEALLENLLNELNPGAEHERGHADVDSAPAAIPELQLQQRAKVLAIWQTEIDKTREAIAAMASGLRVFDVESLDACLSNQTALLLHTADEAVEVDFVSFVKPFKNLQGRVAQLDGDGGLMHPSNFLPRRNFEGALFVLPQCGARVRKGKRDTMPTEAVRLRDMFRAAVDAAAGLAAARDFDCEACCACEQSSAPADLFRCSLCLLTWHSACSVHVASHVAAHIRSACMTELRDEDVRVEELPFFLMWPDRNQHYVWTQFEGRLTDA